MTSKNVTASIILKQYIMCRVNNKRCAGTRDENWCVYQTKITVCVLISCPSAPFVVDSVHLYSFSVVDAVVFLLIILLIYLLPHIKLVYLGSFRFVQVVLKVPSCIKFLILDVFMFPRPLDSLCEQNIY